MGPFDCRMSDNENRWYSVDSHIDLIGRDLRHSMIEEHQSYPQYWHTIFRLYVLLFASRRFVTCQFAINRCTCYLSETQHGPIVFLCFRPAMDGRKIISLVFVKYILTSADVIIELLLLDFNDVPLAIPNIWTIYPGLVQRVMHLDSWIEAAWWSSFGHIRYQHSVLFRWNVWHQ